MVDPFQFGREVVGAELVDRERETQTVLRAMRGRTRLFLIGPRRFGKTSIIATAAAQSEELGGIVIRVNAERFPGGSALATGLMVQAAKRIKSPFRKAPEQVGLAFKALRPSINYDPLTDNWSIKVSPGQLAHDSLYLTEALDSIDRLAGELTDPVAVVIDEFQKVVESEGIDAEARLRAAIQTHRHVGYVFAGSATAMLTAMTSEHGRPFYRLGSRLHLGPVPRTDFGAHIAHAFARAGKTITDEAVEAILDLAADVPYSVQLLASQCWEESVFYSKRKTVGTEEVNAALDAILDLEDPQYATLVDLLSNNQKRALHAVATSDGTGFTSTASARRYGVAVSTLRRAVEGLIDKSILRRVHQSGKTSRVVFEDPFLKTYAKRHIVWP